MSRAGLRFLRQSALRGEPAGGHPCRDTAVRRQRDRERARRRAEDRITRGLCAQCGLNPHEHNRRLCISCGQRRRANERERYRKASAPGPALVRRIPVRGLRQTRLGTLGAGQRTSRQSAHPGEACPVRSVLADDIVLRTAMSRGRQCHRRLQGPIRFLPTHRTQQHCGNDKRFSATCAHAL